MPNFKIAKTSNKQFIPDNLKIEDKLYIYKETSKLGKMYYDFDNNTRIEIGTNNFTYYLDESFNDDLIVCNINELQQVNIDNTYTYADILDIQINSLVVTNDSPYVIYYINRDTKQIYLKRIFIQKNLKWNDYY